MPKNGTPTNLPTRQIPTQADQIRMSRFKDFLTDYDNQNNSKAKSSMVPNPDEKEEYTEVIYRSATPPSHLQERRSAANCSYDYSTNVADRIGEWDKEQFPIRTPNTIPESLPVHRKEKISPANCFNNYQTNIADRIGDWNTQQFKVVKTNNLDTQPLHRKEKRSAVNCSFDCQTNVAHQSNCTHQLSYHKRIKLFPFCFENVCVDFSPLDILGMMAMVFVMVYLTLLRNVNRVGVIVIHFIREYPDCKSIDGTPWRL